MSLSDLRWIAAWNHQGDSQLIHAIPDNEGARRRVGLGNMGMYATAACKIGLSWRHSSFMRLIESPDDGPVEKDEQGWVTDYHLKGRDFDPDNLPYPNQRVCARCASRIRTLKKQKENS